MPPDPPIVDGNSSFSEFLADYFVECDEHLSIARNSLLALEPLLPQAKIDRALLDELFRSFHSLKGLSAMVDFREAEQLAHHLESFLIAVRKNQTPLRLPGLELLMEGVGTLEQIIAARRDGARPADVTAFLGRIAAIVPTTGTIDSSRQEANATIQPVSPRPHERLIDDKMRTDGRSWQFTFVPSAELVVRKVDVNSIRKKLQDIGEILHSAPIIGQEGRIEFSFVLMSSAAEEAVLALQGDGLSCVPYTSPQPQPEDFEGTTPLERIPGETSSTHLTPANIVRVDLEKLDDLMRMVGELVLSRARLEDGLGRLQGIASTADVRSLRETTTVIERQLRDLREGVMRVRMVPVREVFARMQFVVRDLVREIGKRVVLKFSGEETQIDKYVVERIMDPLLHLVRNAVSHGLELPEERVAAGKAAEGQIFLRARTTGETVIIEVEDDGRGIDLERVFAKAQARGIVAPQATMHPEAMLDILCVPGFSTRDNSDRVSGRGIGMDVVRTGVEELGGMLSMHTQCGQGTRFSIQLPLTLAITDALIVKVGAQRYAVPQVAVREIIRIEAGSSTLMENNELLQYREGALPLIRLSRAFGTSASNEEQHFALVIGSGVQAVAVAVDRVLGLREIVVRPLTDRLVQVPNFSGATELGDGCVVLILDTASLGRGVRKLDLTRALPPTQPGEPVGVSPRTNHTTIKSGG